MNATTSANKKRRWNSIVLAFLLALIVAVGGPMVDQKASTSPAAHLTVEQVSSALNGNGTLLGFLSSLLAVPNAYADDECDGIGPQPDLDCPATPTPTATATPDPGQ